jgi:cullin 3
MPGSGLVVLIDDDRIPDLRRLYELFGRPGVPEGLEVLKRALKKTIQTRGSSINAAVLGVADTDKAAQGGEFAAGDVAVPQAKKPTLSGAAAVAAALRWVQEVVDLKDKFDRILKEALGENRGIQMAMNEVGT